MPQINGNQWDQFIADHPDLHLLQRTEWGTLKSSFGWYARYIQNGKVGAQVLFRKLPLGFTIAYIPKGPVGPTREWKQLFPDLDQLCKKNRSIFLKIEPDRWAADQPEMDSIFSDWAHSAPPIQPLRTIIIDLDGDDETWLMRMKQKTRYNIRLAAKKEIIIRESGDLDAFNQLMSVTGERDEFGVHASHYYELAYSLFAPDHCAILQAEYQARPLAAIMVFTQGTRAWYFYGASSNEERNRMPTYLLQFEALRWAANHGCTEYDLWGIPDADEDELEAHFKDRSDGLWGVYRFKRGFGGAIKRSANAYDRVYHPILYRLYQRFTRSG